MNRQDTERLDWLLLLIQPDAADRAEIATLQKRVRNQPHVDDSDPDPDGIAAGMHMSWHEQYTAEKRRDERKAVLAERYYAKRFKEMNNIGLRG